MDLTKLSLGDKIIGGTTIVLLIDLLFLPWHSVSVHAGIYSASYTRGATESPNGFLGILALLVVIAILATVIIRKLTTTKLPDLPISWGEATFYAGIAVEVLLVLKLILKTDYLGYGSYLAIILAAGLIYGTFLGRSESDAPAAGKDDGPATPF
ncbi:MAG TPA: hypothetical protein VGM93_05695 [Acidimicrobiales bacterium]|jgi:hypothetical protein